MVLAEDIKQWIEQGLPQSKVSVTGDGRHFEAMVICQAFKDKNLMERHRMVYAILGKKMQVEIHALSLKTLTEEEFSK